MIRRRYTNAEIADALERVADLLEAEGADAWRVRGWRGGAATLRTLERPVVSILDEEGVKGLIALPTIGKSLSAAIQEYAEHGSLEVLDRLEGEVGPSALFTTLPGIGEDLAERIHRVLGVETLEDLEAAAHDGRLGRVPGFGERRVHAVRDALDTMLTRAGRRRAHRYETPRDTLLLPSVASLLAIDESYRRGAIAGSLERVAPRRFNPGHTAWMPVLREERDGWAFVATYSNTARAHDLHTTHDWVVIRAAQGTQEVLHTAVTERRGPLTGFRVIRGRETECAQHYGVVRAPPPPPGT